MSGLLKNKTLLYLLGGVIVVAGVYYVWKSQGPTPTLVESAAMPGSQHILDTLNQLHTINLDPTIFTDPVFMSLSDFGVTIPPQQAGRRNPFAPVGSTGAPAKQSGQGAQ